MKNKNADSFIFDSYSIDKKRREFKFRYRLIRGGKKLDFIEVLTFPASKRWNKVREETLGAILKGVHLILGISYWKTYCPKRIETPNYALSKSEANFWNVVYTNGLGEFFYKNKIDFRGLVQFPHSKHLLKAKSYQLKAKDRSLLLFGGGKDSLVSAELMKKSKMPFDFFFLATGEVAGVAKTLLPPGAIIVERRIDPKLFKLNKKHGVWNGHIPITGIIGFVSELVAALYGYRNVIFSNEASANYGNVRYLGKEINHQWSKSLEFEKILQDYTHQYITPSITQFSLLRPFHEIKVVEIFSHYQKYFKHFTSCNRHFRVARERPKTLWCGECPKCAFVFSMMSAFVSKKILVRIFDRNLYADKTLIPLFKELLGVEKFKPFECVGIPEEVAFAMKVAAHKADWSNDVVIKALKKDVDRIAPTKNQAKRLFAFSNRHLIPKEFIKTLPK